MMKIGDISCRLLGKLGGLACAAWLGGQFMACGAEELTFAALQIGTRTYKNVTVSSKTKTYVVLMHAEGLMNLKVAEMPPELRQTLGYAPEPEKPKSGAAAASSWAEKEVAKFAPPEVQKLGKSLRERGLGAFAAGMFNPAWLAVSLCAMLLFHIAFCFCCRLICEKTGNSPGALIWIPVLNLIPMLKAAGMSPGWIVAFVLPLLNIIAQIVWSFKISAARGKSAWVGLLLILPVTGLFAFLYLAFSSGADKEDKKAEPVAPQLMTLETA
jgi:hypothetical protein